MSTMYCTQADIETTFGQFNVSKWADRDNDGDGTKIAARIARALEVGASKVDDALRGGRYALPFSDPVPIVIREAAAKLAGVWLYEGRGLEDNGDGQPLHRLSAVRRDAEKDLRMIRAGTMLLATTPAVTTTPQVLEEEPLAPMCSSMPASVRDPNADPFEA